MNNRRAQADTATHTLRPEHKQQKGHRLTLPTQPLYEQSINHRKEQTDSATLTPQQSTNPRREQTDTDNPITLRIEHKQQTSTG